MFLKDSKKTNKKTQDLELGINEPIATATAETQTEFKLESKLEESKIDSKNKIIQKNVVDKGTQYISQLNVIFPLLMFLLNISISFSQGNKFKFS